jgi:hypothetical protein
MIWTCQNGIRVESADEEVFRSLKNLDVIVFSWFGVGK